MINKWNGREFAARHGFPLPELHWWGRDRAAAPLESLPDRFVVRAFFGQQRRGVRVVVDGEEVLWGGDASPRGLRRALNQRRLRRANPILIEEFVEPPAGMRLPLELKLHVFGSEVGALEVTERSAAAATRRRFYSPDWEPIEEPLNTYIPMDETLRERPEELERMLELGSAAGAALGTYMRVDLLLGAGGFCFGEFASVPAAGRFVTPYCNRWFGELWARNAPGAF